LAFGSYFNCVKRGKGAVVIMADKINLNSLRAQKARLSAHIGKLGFETAVGFTWIFGFVCLYCFINQGLNSRAGFGFLSLTLLIFMLAIWDKWDLQKLPPANQRHSLDDFMDAQLLAGFKKNAAITPHSAWQEAIKHWQARFLTLHLEIDANAVAGLLADNAESMEAVWQSAQELMDKAQANEIHSGTLAAGLIISSKEIMDYLSSLGLKLEDVVEVFGWEERLHKFMEQPKPYFGGFGRDWAAGFTPTLDRFASNISRQVEAGNGHFHTLAHADILDPIVHNLNSGSVTLVGEPGTGKSSLVYALAERLLKGGDEGLKYYQIFSLDASAILSTAKSSLEDIMLTLISEAVHAQNIIIFLDDAQLFLSEGTGSFDASQILLPLLQNQNIKIIAAFAPDEFQELKKNRSDLAAHLPTVAVKEPDSATVVQILEDTALTVEAKNSFIVSYPALKEAYRLSDQYVPDLAYPGKAISLLEQSVPYTVNKFINTETIQLAVERIKGVKVASATGPEAEVLLHLEDQIHTRMINQERAVKVVSAALRRGRAGVANPSRPIGSFLFLGPTGVGKTELAKSLAAIYFGDERFMIRLDMSEYQQAGDVERLLEAGGSNTKSLILQIREQPFSVILLDEVEKAHPNILNLLLQLLDEGQLTDSKGHITSFRDSIIISTSNAGAVEISQRVAAGDSLESFERPLIKQLINGGQFKPELINRFDEIVLFRPLNKEELSRVAQLMLADVNKNLSNKNIAVQLTAAALQKVVEAGYDPEFGARPMRRALQKMVEDSVAKKVLAQEAKAGSTITLDVQDLSD
jgi:ATP-dependent Clp protease ATP-binding subunit ClpC